MSEADELFLDGIDRLESDEESVSEDYKRDTEEMLDSYSMTDQGPNYGNDLGQTSKTDQPKSSGKPSKTDRARKSSKRVKRTQK